MEEPRWTLDELAERVDAALAVDYPGPPSGRVRAVPDPRAIRWYTTIGLIDRPIAHRGRTALYGLRHLLQLVAVKRLQAKGLPLVAIQQELAGATDTQLARVAHLPSASVAPSGGGLASPPTALDVGGPPGTGRARGEARTTARWTAAGRPGFGGRRGVRERQRGNAARPGAEQPGAEQPGAEGQARAEGQGEAPVPPGAGMRAEADPTRAVGGRSPRSGFWREEPAAFISPAPGADPRTPTAEVAPDPPASLATLRGVRLGEGTTLLLEPGRDLDGADLQAILDAARPLLAVLRERGLGRTAVDLGPGLRPRAAGGRELGREHP